MWQFEERPLSWWIERQAQSKRILAERQSEVSIMEADVRLCEKKIRELSGYGKIQTPDTQEKE